MTLSTRLRTRLQTRRATRRRGTSLVELLVVIVVFLIGILAVAQIFPGGFRILTQTRERSLATTVARAESERLKARPDLLPEAILPSRIERVGGALVSVTDDGKSPNEFAPTAVGIDQSGNAIGPGGETLGPWGRLSGPNTFRRIVGETHPVGAPRFLSPFNNQGAFGGLVTVQFGPIDLDPANPQTLAVYGRDMAQRIGAVPASPTDVPREYEYVLTDPFTSDAVVTLPAPQDPAANPAQYHLAMAVYLNEGGTVVRREIELLNDAIVLPAPIGQRTYRLDSIAGIVPAGTTLVGVEPDSLRIARTFRLLPAATPFSVRGGATGVDPYEYKIVNAQLGVFLFNPEGYARFEQRPGEARRPFAARFNYDVYDWRILHEDFRIPAEKYDGLAATDATPSSVRLPITPIKTNSDPNADGTQSMGFESLLASRNGYDPSITSDPASSYFILLDLETGGLFYETYSGRRLIDVNKSSGRVRFLNSDTAAGAELKGWLYLPDGTSVQVPLANRAVRAFYGTRKDWAVQVLRAPARYTRFVPTMGSPVPVSGTYYVGGTDATLGGLSTRLYFSPSEAGRKVSVGRINYFTAAGRQTFEGGDFVLRYAAGSDSIASPLPSIDIADIDGAATTLDASLPAAAVKGASVLVRVFHNEGNFRLGPDAATNLNQAFQRYLQQWRVDRKETFLSDGDPLL